MGESLGDVVGLDDGETLGDNVGLEDGELLGEDEGLIVGAELGDVVGFAVQPGMKNSSMMRLPHELPRVRVATRLPKTSESVITAPVREHDWSE